MAGPLTRLGYSLAMSERNVATALRVYQAFNERDLETFIELTHEDAEIHSRIVAMEGGFRGIEGAKRWWRDFLETIPDYRIEVAGEVREIGDATVAELRASGHGASSDAPLDETLWQLARWRDGKYVWWQNFPTEAEALAAAEEF